MTLFGSLDTWLLIGFLIVGVCGLVEILGVWMERRARR